AVFSTIRDSPDRKKKITFASLSKKALPFHKWTGSLAFMLIMAHAAFILSRFGFLWRLPKFASGLAAAIVLAALVTTGWMRLFRPSGKKRMAHIYLGLSMYFLILLH